MIILYSWFFEFFEWFSSFSSAISSIWNFEFTVLTFTFKFSDIAIGMLITIVGWLLIKKMLL